MAKHPYLTQSGPRGLYSFRRHVPERLRPIIGKREVNIALKTADRAQALARYGAVAAEVEAMFAEAEKKRSAAAPQPTGLKFAGLSPDATLTALRYASAEMRAERATLQASLEQRWQAPGEAFRAAAPPLSAFAGGGAQGSLGIGAHCGAAMDGHRRALQQRILNLQAARLARDCRDLGVPVPATLATIEAPHPATLDVELQVLTAMLANAALAADGQSEMGRGGRAGERNRRRSDTGEGGPQLSVAAEAWVEAHAGTWSAEGKALCATVLRDFIQVAGDKPLASYGKRDGRDFVDILRRLPPNVEKRRPGLRVSTRNLRKIAEAAGAAGLTPQSPQTINKKIGILDRAFRWIDVHYDGCPASPVAGMRVPLRRSAKEQKEAFSIPELNVIFHAPIYAGCRSELHWMEPGRVVLWATDKFWVPLIALFSGMRSGEILPLRTDHVRVHQGVHYFALTPELRLKNPSSVRSIPVHRALIACGFLDFVAGQRASQKDRLFPNAPKHPSGRYSDAFGKHFHRFLTLLGIKAPGRDLHSLRHNFASAAEACGVEFAVRERLLGHVLPGEGGRYGQTFPQEQRDMELMLSRNRDLQKLTYPDLQLEHLQNIANREP